MTPEERRKKAEELAGPHDGVPHGSGGCSLTGCSRRERVAAILAFGEAEHAAGRKERDIYWSKLVDEQRISDAKFHSETTEKVRVLAHAAGKAEGQAEEYADGKAFDFGFERGKAEGRREGDEVIKKLSEKLAEARDRGYNEGPER